MAFFQAQHLWVKHLADGVAALMLDRQDSATNDLDPAMLDEIARALDAVAESGQYRLLLIRSGKPANFCLGAPSSMLATWKKGQFSAWAEQGQKVCAKLSALPIPSVAVIAGSCMDAGLELALACDYRVVVNRPATSFGFPALDWGMIPCWGGTQRLPRLIGLENSLRMLLAGARQNARQAWLTGLADEFAEETGQPPGGLLENPRKRDSSKFPRRTWHQRFLESNRLGRRFLFGGAERILRTRIPAEMPAPGEILAALRFAYQSANIADGLQFERQALERIAEHAATHHLLRLLQQREKLRTTTNGQSEEKVFRHVGINGSSVLGLSLLLQGVAKGHEVVLRTKDDVSLGSALAQIIQVLHGEVQNGNMTAAQYQKSLSAIRGTFEWTHFDKLDLLLDTDNEGSLNEKQAFYREMEKHVPESALLITTALSYRVEDLRLALRHTERLLGLHIIEPWKSGSLAEVVVPSFTSPTAAAQVRDWAVHLGKCGLEVPDRLGGLAMRIWLPALHEAGVLLSEGFEIDVIDAAMRRFGMTYGPLEWMDRIGLDQIASLVSACQPLFADRITFANGFALMQEKQWLGNRTKLGFYRYGRSMRPHRKASDLWWSRVPVEIAAPTHALSKADTQAWIRYRLVTLMILEAARCLDEGVARDADDLDCAMCLTGWATHRGGPIGYARELGYEAIAAACVELSKKLGARFAPITCMRTILSDDSTHPE